MKIALYLRVSTNVQDYNRQKSDLTAQATKEGKEIAFIFKDKVSGFKSETDREDLNKLLQLTKDDIQAVYCTELSRLSRNPTHLKVLIEHFTERGINIYFQSQDINTLDRKGKTSFTTNIIIAILSEFSAYEIEIKNERQKSGRKESVTVKGNSYTGKTPYGYTKEGELKSKKLVINPKEAEIIQYIFNQYSEGKGIKDLVQYLNLNKVPTRNSDFMKQKVFKVNKTKVIDKDSIKWGKSSVRNILRNTVYCGYVTIYERDKKKNIVSEEVINTPAIITEVLFNQCQESIKGRITNTDKSRVNNFMLRGILNCGYCGKPFVGTSTHQHLLYKCSDKTQVKSNSYVECRNTSIYKENIEPIIWNTVKSAYSQLRTQQIKESNINNSQDIITECNNQIEVIENELSKLTKESDRIINLYAKGLFSDSQIEKEQRRINAEIEALTRSRRKYQLEISKHTATLEAINNIDNKPFDLTEIEKSFDAQKEAVKELVKEILIYKVDNKYTVFQVSFKSGLQYYILREVWTKKYAILDNNIYTYNTESMMFTYNGSIGKGLNYEPITITQTPKELFKQCESNHLIESEESYQFAVKEENKLSQLSVVD